MIPQIPHKRKRDRKKKEKKKSETTPWPILSRLGRERHKSISSGVTRLVCFKALERVGSPDMVYSGRATECIFGALADDFGKWDLSRDLEMRED